MKWLTLAGILYLTRCDGAVLKCSPGSEDALCTSEKSDITPRLLEAECLAGTQWESNCHSCRCTDSGVAECVKQNACKLEKNEPPIKCKPNTSFKRDCNTCTCLENGLGICTMMGCLHFETDRRKRSAPAQDNENKCTPGAKWKESCNSCWCTDNGVPVCTKIGCLGNISKREAPEKECEPGTMWKKSCNKCWCSDNGIPLCTKKGCYEFPSPDNEERPLSESDHANGTFTRKTRAAQEAQKACQPGTEFRMDCNKCLCNELGQDFSCTRIDCAAQNGNGGGDTFGGARSKRDLSETVSMQCVAGSVFDRECNVCRCTEDGSHAVCTLKRCKKETIEQEVTESTPSFRCTPGDQFKRDCKDCTCAADGKTVFCTLRLCDEPQDIDVGN